MAGSKFVSYCRVSTERQGRSGLGLEAQRAAVAAHVTTCGGTVVAEMVEVESGSHNDRVQLAAAFRVCRLHRATLLVAKLDRLSRDAGFLMSLDRAGVDFVCADNPHATRLTIGVLAVVADEERRAISSRTKAALQAAKARGVVLGGDRGGKGSEAGRKAACEAVKALADRRTADTLPIIRELQAAGVVSLGAIARAMIERAVPKARGGLAWTSTDVRNALARVA